MKLIYILKWISLIIIVLLVWLHLRLNYSNKSHISRESLPISVNQMKQIINDMNEKQKVLNYEIYGPLKEKDIVIIVQVHNRVQYLLALIKSLEQTKHINEVLIVFSHDIYDNQINSIINSIKFCKVSHTLFAFII
jgi:alpha-1,6-mannosyl-glycoprotein beta-1,2-N-acetylglucosaminyltransferase